LRPRPHSVCICYLKIEPLILSGRVERFVHATSA
jgi:hypothetical protein